MQALGYTYYKMTDEENAPEMVCDNEDIYMIKFAERGNQFFLQSGDFFFGPDNKDIPEDAIILYLLKGEEIIAYDVTSADQSFKYYLSPKRTDLRTIPKSEVFIIKYPNRPNEIVTPITRQSEVVSPKKFPLPEDKFVELKEGKPAQEYVIRTTRNITIRAMVVYECDAFVSYYRKESPRAPLYRISRENIRSMKKVSSYRNR